MISTKYCFTFQSYSQAEEIIKLCKLHKINPVLFVKFHLINRLGISWFEEFNYMLKKKFKNKFYLSFVDTKKDYGLFISLVEKKIDFIKVEGSQNTIKRLKEIALLNKVLVNPNFSVIDLANSKNISSKIKKLTNEYKK